MPSVDDGMQAQLAEMARTVAQLQLAVLALTELMQRPVVHLNVDHMAVDRFEFRIDQIDVDKLTGEMNIGVTTSIKHRGEQPIHPIWPPIPEQGGDAGGEQSTPAGRTGARGDAGGTGR